MSYETTNTIKNIITTLLHVGHIKTTKRNQKYEQVLKTFFDTWSVNGLKIKPIGIVRTTGIIALINLTYKYLRFEQIKERI